MPRVLKVHNICLQNNKSNENNLNLNQFIFISLHPQCPTKYLGKKTKNKNHGKLAFLTYQKNLTLVASEHGVFYHYLWDLHAWSLSGSFFEHLGTMYEDDWN